MAKHLSSGFACQSGATKCGYAHWETPDGMLLCDACNDKFIAKRMGSYQHIDLSPFCPCTECWADDVRKELVQ
jgi:hypothetical protein